MTDARALTMSLTYLGIAVMIGLAERLWLKGGLAKIAGVTRSFLTLAAVIFFLIWIL